MGVSAYLGRYPLILLIQLVEFLHKAMLHLEP